MANEMWKRYLDAGMAFRDMTRKRAEEFVADLVSAGVVQQERAQKAVDELLDRSRKNTADLVALVQAEIKSQVSSLGIATTDDIKRLDAKISQLSKGSGQSAKKTTTKKAAAKKGPAKKAAAKRR
jgi:polyhydroxyalkanoate synthesis regulator phasin